MKLFEKEIIELENLDAEILKKDAEKKEVLSNSMVKIQAIDSFNVEADIKDKVDRAFRGMDEVVQNYIETENLLYPEKKIFQGLLKNTQLLNNSLIENDFLGALKNSYKIFYEAQANFSFAKYGNNDNDRLVEQIVKSYLTVKYIKDNLTKLLLRYINEPERKRQEKAQIERERDEKISALDAAKRALVEKAETKIADLDENFAIVCDEDRNISSILPETKVQEDFSNRLFCLGSLLAEEEETVVLDMPSIGVRKTYGMPAAYTIDLIKEGNFFITYQEEEAPKRLWDIIKALTFRWITRYPGAYKRVMAIHDNVFSNFGNVLSFVSECGKDDCLVMRAGQEGIQSWTDRNSLSDAFEKIKNIIQNRSGIIGNCKNIFEYNQKNPSNAQSLLLVYVMDFDFSEKDNWLKKMMKAFLEAGKKVGLYFIFIYNLKIANKVISDMEEFTSLPEYCFLQKGEKAYLVFDSETTDNGTVGSLDCLYGFENITENNIIGVKKQIDGFVAALDFIEDFQNKYVAEDHDYLDKLIIPVGIHGSKIQTMILTRNGLNAHAIIEGASGAGKTSMLNNIILSAAYNYSPEELEIYIFDFKKGNENFIPFGDLKHVKYIGVNQNAQDTMECMQYIRGLLENNKNDKKPRVLIVVDEYTNMQDNYKCKEELVDMVRKARSFGGDMFFSSQNASIKEILEQCGNRFEMYENENYQLIDRVETLFPEIKNKDSRLVVFSDDKNKPCVDLKFPYVGKNISEIIKLINEKYKSCKADKIRLDENPKLSMKNYPNVNYSSQGFYVPIGERYLTRQRTSFYFDNDRSQKILLIGDVGRSASIERIVANAFIEVNKNETSPCVYYLNFDNSVCFNPIQEIKNNNLVRIANSDKEKGELLHELYDLYRNREEANYNGKSDFSPIMIVLHCAGNAKQSFKNLEKFGKRDSDNEIDNKEFRRINIGDKWRQSEQKSSESFNYSDTLREIFDSNLDFHLIMHYQDWREAYSHERIPGAINDFTDRMFVPTLSSDDQNDLHTEAIVQAISRLTNNSNKFDVYYRDKMQDIGTNSANRKEMLRYVIFIENESPCLLMPYEYEV